MLKSKLPHKRTYQNQVASNEAHVSIRADLAQIEELLLLGAITSYQAELGRKAGGLLVSLPAQVVSDFQAEKDKKIDQDAKSNLLNQVMNFSSTNSELDDLAGWIERAGLGGPARLLLTGGKPVSFVSSQFLLMIQPLTRMSLGDKLANVLEKYSKLLEQRSNLDQLVQKLDEIEINKKRLTKKEAKE